MTALTPTQQETIKQEVCEILEVDPAAVSTDSLFKEEHDADSMRAIEILASLERLFDIEIPQASMARMVNLRGIHTVVAEALDASTASTPA
ncbi:polyketide-8 synthase acyl carrier protein [Plantibacter flavus]|uniref:acyl carrier protein n=1 Tax=Plantibacter TaxID=190323 RepID=UPI0010C1E995|nr:MULTISPECIES: acyl carrier protein [Plantibacter]MBD8104613.1 acyl carrier protein [Plantibacter sp. CFBP 8775]MBD8535142.1 acyl carrier protein [Plantibacter sp. CFBP 13570]TKJ95872.1 polyketide-8 synthase acyl carrier protein [Plantibacter flavus]